MSIARVFPRKHSIYFLILILLFLTCSQSTFAGITLLSGTCDSNNYEIGSNSCKSFSCYENSSGQFSYDLHEVQFTDIFFLGSEYCQITSTTTTNAIQSSQQQNTNSTGTGSWPGGTPPSGCNLGVYGATNPWCGGGFGGGSGDGCPYGEPEAGLCTSIGGTAVCGLCNNFAGDCCSAVPSSCKGPLGCPTGDDPTPTPATAEYCSLTCPGELISGGAGGNTGGSGVVQKSKPLAQNSVSKTKVLGSRDSKVLAQGLDTGTGGNTGGSSGDLYYAEVPLTGSIQFDGYDGFNCDIFNDGLGYEGPCPEPTIVSGGGGTSGTVNGASDRRTQDKNSRISPIRSVVQYISRLLDENNTSVLGISSSRMLAQGINDSGGSGTNGGTSGQQTEWTSDSNRYHIIPGASETRSQYSATASDLSAPASCGCTVALGCQKSLRTSPNVPVDDPNAGDVILEGCSYQCDFEIVPEYPQAIDPIVMNISANDGFDRVLTVELDDANNTVINNANFTEILDYGGDAGTFDIKLTCSNPGNNSRTCTRRLNVYCADPFNLPTPTPSPQPTPGPWVKVKSSSVHVTADFTNTIPEYALPYDDSDAGTCDLNNQSSIACFNIGEPGVVVVDGTSSFGSSPVSYRGWLRNDSSYNRNTIFTPSTFLEYARARKDVNDIDVPDTGILTSGLVQANAINVISTPATLLINDDSPTTEGPFILVVNGDITIDMSSDPNNTFNNDDNPIILMSTGTIEISSNTRQLNGIFIAQDFDFSYDVTPSTNTLKVNGNIISENPANCSDYRNAATNWTPSCYFDTSKAPSYMIPLLDLMSTRNYQWTELIAQ